MDKFNQNISIIDITEDEEQKYIHFFKVDKETDLYFVQMGHHVTSPGYSYGPFVRNHYLIHFVKSGKGVFIIHNTRYEITAGTCFVIEPQQIAYYQSDLIEPWEYFWIGFGGYHARSYVEQMGFSYDRQVQPISSSSQVFTEFSRIDNIGYDMKNYLAYFAALYYILYYMDKPLNDSNLNISSISEIKKPFNGDVVEIISKLIQNSYNTHLLVNEIAKQLSLDRGYLGKIFKNQTGMSIKEYLTDYRLSIAAKLLRTPSKSVEKVALEVGISDPFYFSRLFKQKYGISPNFYRKRI